MARDTAETLNQPSRVLIPSILLITGLSGFVLGWLHPNWQLAVEAGQVVGGIVAYPEKLPLYQYYVNIWTILNQICALFLRLGISEGSLSFFLSGLMGMVGFQALALCIFTFSRNFFLALVFPFLILFILNPGWGMNYGIVIIGDDGTYGALSITFPLLVIGLFGVKYYKLGALLLGMAPAIHPSTGLYLNLVILTCLLWDFEYFRRYLKGIIGALLFGYALSGLSLAYHLAVAKPELGFMSEDFRDYMSAFVRYWDLHRFPIGIYSVTFLLFVDCLLISLFCLTKLRTVLARDTLFLLRIFVVSGVFSLSFSAIHFLPPEKVPSVLLAFMPARFLNFNILGSVILLIGLLDFYKDHFLFGLTFCILLVALFFFPRLSAVFVGTFSLVLFILLARPLKFSPRLSSPKSSFRSALVISGFLCLIYGFYLALGKSHNPAFFERYTLHRLVFIGLCVSFWTFTLIASILKSQRLALLNRPVETFEWIPFVVFCLITIIIGTSSYFGWETRKEGLKDWTSDPFFLQISRQRGIILTSSDIHFIQLRTRRPVLLDGWMLDILPYTPESGPAMNQILNKIYGVDLFKPPPDIPPGQGGLLRDTGRILWEKRTPKEWSEIRKRFNVTNVLTYSDWDLRLPVIARNRELALYRISLYE